jgi:hypothetical protein
MSINLVKSSVTIVLPPSHEEDADLQVIFGQEDADLQVIFGQIDGLASAAIKFIQATTDALIDGGVVLAKGAAVTKIPFGSAVAVSAALDGSKEAVKRASRDIVGSSEKPLANASKKGIGVSHNVLSAIARWSHPAKI